MELQIDSTDPQLRRVRLLGRLDSAGGEQIDLRFNAATAAAGLDTIVDLSGVEFIASLGIRILMKAARTLSSKGRKLVLFAPEGLVAETLRDGGIDQLIPTAGSDADAVAAIAAS